jgi:hypothetical protein
MDGSPARVRVGDRASIAALSLAIDAGTARVGRAFAEHGIPCLLLKGPSTARWLYRDGTPRPYGDTDLLIPPYELKRAEEVLLALGYRPLEGGRHSHERTPHAGLWGTWEPFVSRVDLHQALAMVPRARAGLVWTVLNRSTETLAVAGATMRTPDGAGRCLVVALHAAQHGYTEAKPLEDLRRARAVAASSTWAAARELALELGAEAAFDVGLAMVEVDSGALLSRDEWRRVPGDIRLYVQGSARGSHALNAALNLPLAARLKFAVRHALPSPALLETTDGAGRSSRLTARVARLVRIARQLPAAVLDVRETRRSGSA